jgi:hypothetical protein
MSVNANKDFFKTSQKGTRLPAPIAVSHDALLAKSKLFAKRSVDAKQASLETECQLWAAGALELLAKAQLAGIHPSLVVEPENTNSLLEACGVSTSTKVRTINAAVAYARLNHTVPHFSTPVIDNCKKLAERRNAELHSGEAACAAMPYERWEGDFWNAADLILMSMGMDLQEWLGADAKAPKALLKAHRQAEVNAAKQRVIHHASEFKKTGNGKLGREKLNHFRAETLKQPIDHKSFHYQYSQYWRHVCPACKSWGSAAGDLTWDHKAEDQDDAEFGYEIIERTYSPSEFHCPTCGLSLVGDAAVNAAGINEDFIETREIAIKYEPDYGND